ncbi:MAG: FAD-dependent oxidoreductase, partial [Acidobacteriota bacterium]|nr:FAD-dependent oxidoreductase [Acidobacteriota bacterium]
DSLRRGLLELCTRLPILRHPDAIIVGPESRSSCPVRIIRDRETLASPSAAGLYPMGEGAGHAGGIMSAAIDGMRCAEAFIVRPESV